MRVDVFMSDGFLISALDGMCAHLQYMLLRHAACSHTPLHTTEQLSLLFINSAESCLSQRVTLSLSHLSDFMMIFLVTPFTLSNRRNA